MERVKIVIKMFPMRISSFSDDMTSRLKNNDRFGAGGQSYIFESEKNSLELATDNAPIIEAPDGTSTPRSGPSPNAPMSHKGRG